MLASPKIIALNVARIFGQKKKPLIRTPSCLLFTMDYRIARGRGNNANSKAANENETEQKAKETEGKERNCIIARGASTLIKMAQKKKGKFFDK